jgi:putative membrane protein
MAGRARIPADTPMNFLWRWLILAVAVFVAVHLKFLGISCEGFGALLTVSLLLGIVNTFVRPLLLLLTLPAVIFSFGLAILFINALLFYGVGHMVDGFHVNSFASAFGGSLVISLVSLLLGGSGARRQPQQARRPAPAPRTPPPGKGPIIDV